MRRFPGLRGLVTGFALIGLFTAVLAGATSGPAHATVTGEASETLPVFSSSLPSKITVVAVNDTASYTTPTAYEKAEPSEPAKVSCTPAPSDLVTPGTTTTVTCTAIDTKDPTATNWNTYKFSLTSLDEPTKLSTPGYPWPTATADASDTATVTYTDPVTGKPLPVTAAEGALNVYHEVNEATPNCDSPFNPPRTSPPPAQAAVPFTLPDGSSDGFVSGGTFPLGDTLLACNASDGADNAGANASTSYFHVMVTDPQATLTVPPTYQLATATSSSGATVIYAPGPVTALENGEADTPICSVDKVSVPLTPSDQFVTGGTFPVGGTTVTCAAPVNDDPTNPGPQQSFSVIVTNTPCATLAGCNLHGLDLSNVNLSNGNLSGGTDLSNANLTGANLNRADLTGANLSGANLNKADLTGANLTGANLTGANLNKADLTGADLTGANLTGADLTNAKLDGVTWSNTTCPDGTNSSASTPQICVVSATMTIGNYPPWNGSLASGFGVSGAPSYFTPTYGQTVTVPPTDTVLHRFTFYADLPANLLFRGEVYAWDPNTVDPANPYALGSATGSALYESGQMHTTSYGSGSAPQPITFNIPGGLPLTAGAQYVLFFTTSRDYAANAAANITDTGFVGYTATDTYSGGDLVYVDDGGDPNNWTTLAWTHPAALGCPPCFNQGDLAFTAIFSSH